LRFSLLTSSGRISNENHVVYCQHPGLNFLPIPIFTFLKNHFLSMAATFRTPGRRQGGETLNTGSPSLIPTRATHSTPGTPTTHHHGTSSDLGTNVSVSSDSRKRQSKKDEVLFLSEKTLILWIGNPTEIGIRIGQKGICASEIVKTETICSWNGHGVTA